MSRRVVILASVVVAAAIIVGGVAYGVRSGVVRTQASHRDSLDDLLVDSFDDEWWCTFIDYGRGAYASTSYPRECGYGSNPDPVDAEATKDIQRVRKAFADAGITMQSFSVQ